MPPLGLYLHIPFCSSICNYCNFNRGLFDAQLKERYVRALRQEIAFASDGADADTIFFGGGTPSLLEPFEVAELITACRQGFNLAGDAEITIEANPDTVSMPKLAAFREAGVTRVSFGVQSFRDDELKRLDRRHSVLSAKEAFRAARSAGFDNTSLDLMMWLPGQSVDEWLNSVDQLADLSPDHASLYMLEIYPNAPLRDAMARGRWSVAPDDDVAEMYVRGLERLDAVGYRQYEISNVARPGRESRHNLKYWQDGAWLGFGCGAHSTRGGVRWKNVSSTTEYIAAVSTGGQLVVERRELTRDERLEDALFTGLRLTDGIPLKTVRSKYGVDVWSRFGEDLQPFVDGGVLIYDGARLRLTRAGMLIAHEIMTVFISSAVR